MCLNPISKLLKHQERYIPVPCGRCPKCVKAKLSAWLFRLEQHLLTVDNAFFVTLTYDRKSLPYTDYAEKIDVKTGEVFEYKPVPTLSIRDCQLWIKTLRRANAKLTDKKITYYLVGEYGKKKGRPHYHAIICNVADPDLIHSTWGKGRTECPPLWEHGGAIGYVLKYISKARMFKKDYFPKQPEFSLMSKGIGVNYLTPQIVEYHRRHPSHSYVRGSKGGKLPMPKYFKEKIYPDVLDRLDVTVFQSLRFNERLQKRIREDLEKYPTKTVNDLLKMYEVDEYNVKFAKRNLERL